MIPWMRSRIVEAWYKRKSPRAAEEQSLAPSTSTGNSESNKNMSLTSFDLFPIKVISTDGFVLYIDVKMNTTIKFIKETAVQHFHEMNLMFNKFRLIHVNKPKQLIDYNTVQDEEITCNDELLLMPINSYFEACCSLKTDTRSPNINDVAEATRNLPRRNPSKYIPPLYYSFDVETRKIVLTLAYSSARLLMFHLEAPSLFNTIKKKYKNSCLPIIDLKNLQDLIDLDYSHQKATAALYVKKNDVKEALHWLKEHEEYPLEYFNLSVILNLMAKKKTNEEDCNSPEIIQINFLDACNDLFSDENTKYVEENLLNIVTVVIEYCRYKRQFNFKVDEEWVNKLLEMGFPRENVIEALRICGNNPFNACEWLLGNKESNLLYTDIGYDSNDPFYQEIMNDAQIQLSISNPNTLLAYLKILDEPIVSIEWINDSNVASVINQIYKTYYSEKRIHLS